MYRLYLFTQDAIARHQQDYSFSIPSYTFTKTTEILGAWGMGPHLGYVVKGGKPSAI